MSSKRKPYQPKMSATWWTKLGFYRLYIVRELSAVFTVWFCLELLWGVMQISTGDLSAFIAFLKNPLVVIANVASIAMLLYHAATLYIMTPQVMTFIVKNEQLNPNVLRFTLWGVTAVASLILLIAVLI